jgi:hypothetical protein
MELDDANELQSLADPFFFEEKMQLNSDGTLNEKRFDQVRLTLLLTRNS